MIKKKIKKMRRKPDFFNGKKCAVGKTYQTTCGPGHFFDWILMGSLSY